MGILTIIAVCIVLPQIILAEERPRIEYRLAYGRFGNDRQGLAEVLIGGQAYSICAQGWGDVEARLFCRLVGQPGNGAIATRGDVFERPLDRQLPYFMSRVRCGGSELDIRDCSFTPITRINSAKCPSIFRAGVICENSPFLHPPVRIVGGANEYEGLVQVGIGDKFAKVCDDGWSDVDAQVVCREKALTGGRGVRGGFFPTPPAQVDRDLGFLLDNVQCTGQESSVFQCKSRYVAKDECVEGNEAGVICAESEHPIRLYDGTSFDDGNMQGQVEIKVGPGFTQVCDDRFGEDEARIVCNTLGYFGPAQVANGNHFGNRPRLPISYFKCRGNEDDFYLCYRPLRNGDCQSNTAAGVICSN